MLGHVKTGGVLGSLFPVGSLQCLLHKIYVVPRIMWTRNVLCLLSYHVSYELCIGFDHWRVDNKFSPGNFSEWEACVSKANPTFDYITELDRVIGHLVKI